MYSLMNVGKNYFCHLLSEQVLTDVIEPSHAQQFRGLLTDTITPSVISRILQEPLKHMRVFLETTDIQYVDSEVMEGLQDATLSLLKNENEVYFLCCSQELKEELKKGFQEKGYEIRELYIRDFWYLEIGLQGYRLHELSGKGCYEILHEIHYNNLRKLVADGPKGKSLDMKRLLQDKEEGIFYYCYRLTRIMVEEGLAYTDSTLNRGICLVAGNDDGYYLAIELSKILGTEVCSEKDIVISPSNIKKYIIVRDVIHMFCELSRIISFIEGAGGVVVGATCLIDINTGVGTRKNRASIYTIDLEKGISYRLQNKKKEE